MPRTFRAPDDRRMPDLASVVSLARRRSVFPHLVDVARGRVDGPPVPPEDGVRWLAHELVERVRDRYDSVLALTGEERVSKSTLMLRLDEQIQKETGVPFDFANLVYGGRGLNAAYRRAKPFTCINYDEGSRGILAGDTFNPEQVVVTQLLANAGVRGAILMICIPSIWLLARKVRGRRAVFWVHVDSRGTSRKPAPSHAIVHERDRRLDYTNAGSLRLARSLRCPELTYEPYADTDPFWVRYSAVKDTNLVGLFDENDRRLDRLEKREFGV